MPSLGSAKLPWPCLWVTATEPFQSEIDPSAGYVTF